MIEPPVLIVNYEAIRREATQEYIRKFVSNRPCVLVLDESVQMKTYNSQQTKAALLMAQWFQYKRILSGKPVTQGPHDFWAQMRRHWRYFHSILSVQDHVLSDGRVQE